MKERMSCLIAGCRRTHTPVFAEWLCAKHWALVPRQMRQAYSRAKRKRKSLEACLRLWRRCKAEAIRENFMGFVI